MPKKDKSPEYIEFEKEWLKTHDNLKGCHLKWQNINRHAMEKLAAAEEFEKTDMTEYEAFGIVDVEGGQVLRTYKIIQGRVTEKIDSPIQAKNFLINKGHTALVKQALDK